MFIDATQLHCYCFCIIDVCNLQILNSILNQLVFQIVLLQRSSLCSMSWRRRLKRTGRWDEMMRFTVFYCQEHYGEFVPSISFHGKLLLNHVNFGYREEFITNILPLFLNCQANFCKSIVKELEGGNIQQKPISMFELPGFDRWMFW